MPRRREILLGGALAAAAPAFGRAARPADAAPPRTSELLSDGWRFHLGHAQDTGADFSFGLDQRTYAKQGWGTATAAMPRFVDDDWQAIRVPHDWAVDLPYAPPAHPAEKGDDPGAAHGFKAIGRDHPENSVGWYRRMLKIEPADRDRRLRLEFDGVFRDCLVFVNGYVVQRNESGYAPFGVEIGDFLDYDGGPNVVALRVDASFGEGWFYEGAGIYRDVRLVRTQKVAVPQWGVFVRSEIGAAGARVTASVEVDNRRETPVTVVARQHVEAPDGTRAADLPERSLTLAASAQGLIEADALIAAPRLWSVETPDLYRLVTELNVEGALTDRVETGFGIRAIRFDAERGFFLNGKPVKLLGTCNHHDHAGVGAAIPDRLHAWRVEQLKAMGSNAWRSAHNPPAQALLEACDAQGMLMIAEARLNSSSDEAMGQLERLVRSARNHPCVILWSVGNEEPHQGTPRGARITHAMVARVRALDPTRPTTQAFDNGFGEGASPEVDVIGFNYRTDKIEAYHQRVPAQPVIGTETGSTVSTRGEYANDPTRHIVRAYDTEHPWWATTAEEWWTIVADRPYIAGGFVWTGFDYRGEPTPYSVWPSVSSYFGILDLCGFPKDNYYYYRAWWRPEPMVHLFPHWNWAGREGQPIEVWAHSNCDEVELLVNGRSAGRKPMARNRHLAWSVPYAPGRIEARGYRGGRLIASDRRETTGPAAALNLVIDRRTIRADGRDLVMARIEVVDRVGRVVPTGDALVRFELAGPARLIGVGNGDPTSREPDHAPQRHAFNGLCQAIVQSDGNAGAIRLSAAAEGLRGAQGVILAGG